MNRRVQQFRYEAAWRQPPPRRGQNPSSYDGQTAAAAVSSSSSHCLTLSLHYSHQTSSSLLPDTTTPSTSPFYPLNYPLSHFLRTAQSTDRHWLWEMPMPIYLWTYDDDDDEWREEKNSFLIRDFCREAFRMSHQHSLFWWWYNNVRVYGSTTL